MKVDFDSIYEDFLTDADADVTASSLSCLDEKRNWW